MFFIYLLLLLAFGPMATSHFSLTFPPALGDAQPDHEGQFPCGGIDINTRSNVIDWPTAGMPLGWLTTTGPATWTLRAALMNDTETWRFLMPIVHQTSGQGHCCIPSVPGIHYWIGHDAVVQVIQRSVDGDVFQCVAVKFTALPAVELPDDSELCKNYTARGTITLTVEPDTPTDNKMDLGRNGTTAKTCAMMGGLGWLLTAIAFVVYG